jgi:hypothetical protein
MRPPFPSAATILACCLVWVTGGVAPADEQPLAEQIEFFEKKVRPVLVEHCYECHSADAEEVKGDLRVDTREGIRRGGNTGSAVIPGDLENSVLIQAVRYFEDAYQMPPSGKLPDEVVRDLEAWVEMGAADPRESSSDPRQDAAASASKREHWAFQPPGVAPLPTVEHNVWPRDALDVYLLAGLERAGIAPSADADRRTLLRRVSIDLIGLPPTYEEVAAFERDEDPRAYERRVDALLQSPQFGERWGRHWLDVARYADTKGYVFQEDRNYPEAYTYRDWVVQSLNDDLPYDQFLKYQLSADRLPPLPGSELDSQAALGYLTLGRRFLNNRHDIIDDRIDVVTRGMMGLTVTCARCHDHKYDPIPQQDYYSLYGVFDSSEEPKDAPLRLVDKAQPHDAHVFLRGSPGNRGPVAPRRFLKIVSSVERPEFRDGSGRRELADAITSRENPLTARVMVNRVWLHLFGEGLVSTPSDFGVRSDPPSQPELLDALAVDWMDDGWSLKRLIRRIVLSSSYRQASDERGDAAGKDPENRLFWRQNRRRLDLEALRDSVLAVSGGLDMSLGGPSVDLNQEPYPLRRSVYAFIDRQNLPCLFRTFDFASPDTHSPRRLETTTPQQSLFLMNHPLVMERSEQLAQLLDGGDNDDAAAPRIRSLYQRVLARDPSADAIALGIEFLRQAQMFDAVEDGVQGTTPRLAAWPRFAQVLLMSNEFQFID